MTLYEKNIAALKKNRPKLHKKLLEIKTNEKFEVYTSNDEINILDIKNKTLFYDKPKEAIKKQNKEYEKYREYPFLYMFGLGNGRAVEFLLKNKQLVQLIVIEPSLELIYIALNLVDYSKDLILNRLLILEYEEINYSILVDLIHNSNAKFYIRVFNLIINTNYYENIYINEYKELLSLYMKVLLYIANGNGNDINDTFRGVKQHLENINLMIDSAQYQKLLKKKSLKTAVIVSTGPSLDKQLPLLKKYQDKICILSVDASFPILIKHGIKPDFVFSMERDEPTSIFFKEVEVEKQKDIIFVCASLQHQSVYKAIKSGTKVIVARPFAYTSYFNLDNYGYLCKGMSSANMAHEFATKFNFEQIAFIGQDLAFGKNFKTHSDGHVIKEKNELIEAEKEQNKLIEVEAYGGQGKVLSNIYWNMFRNFIEHHIIETEDIVKVYNSTEGGSSIKGATEISFNEYLKRYTDTKKKLITLSLPKQKEIDTLKKETLKKSMEIIESLTTLKKEVDKSFLIIAEECKKFENIEKEKAIKILDINNAIYLLEQISEIRRKVEENKIYSNFLTSIVQPLMFSMEMEIAEIKVRYIDNPTDNKIKALQWILAHRFWLFSLSGIIDNVIHILKENKKSND